MQYIYLVECQGFRKIGIAGDVESRMASLQTGNPFPLCLEGCYGFENAEIVEKAVHQKFAEFRKRGEWFDLHKENVEEFRHICEVLGGAEVVRYKNISLSAVTDDAVKDAEEVQETMADGAKWDYSKMFADGWRIELAGNASNNYGYWHWRKSDDGKRKSIYGGKVSDLPYPIDSMKEHYK